MKIRFYYFLNILLLITFVFLAGSCDKQKKEEKINYHQTQIPPGFEFLPLGDVKPKGWIKAQLVRDFEKGFLGQLDSLTDYASIKIFGDNRIIGYKEEDGKKKFVRKSWWPGETTAVWLDGLVRMAFLTEHPAAIEKMREYIQYVLRHQGKEGYIGIYKPKVRYQHTMENAELWAQSRIFRVMLAYYELTGDEQVLEAVKKAVDLTMEKYPPGFSYFGVDNAGGGVSHGLMFIDILKWLYRLTGEKGYVEYGKFLYNDYSKNFDNKRLEDARLKYLLDPERDIVGHTPHVAEHLRVPVWLYHATGKEKYRKAYQTGYSKLEDYMVPSGAVHSGDSEDVEGKPPYPDMPYEYCGITELFDTQSYLLAKSGNARYANQAEKLIMNAGQGARFANGKAICYFSRDNRIKATEEGSGGRFKFSPTHEDVAVCCNPNAGKLMPYYVRSMWMKPIGKNKGLAAQFYGPSVVKTKQKGSLVQIKQKTNFPFSDDINFVVKTDEPVKFDLWLRIPSWSNGVNIEIEEADIRQKEQYKIVHKNWKNGDTFRLSFKPEIKTLTAVNGEKAIKRGSLIYALELPDKREVIKTYPVNDFADYNIRPTSKARESWNLRLKLNQQEEDLGFEFFSDTSSSVLYPWEKNPVYLSGSFYDLGEQTKKLRLVPMGSTILRRVTFPE